MVQFLLFPNKNHSIYDTSTGISSIVNISNKIVNVGLFQEKSKQGGWRYTFLKTPLEFLACHFILRYSRENKLSTLEILQNFVTPLVNFKFKNQEPRKLHDFFLYILENSTSFLNDPWNFQMFFLQYLWKFHVLNPRLCLDFFWNSHFGELRSKNYPEAA